LIKTSLLCILVEDFSRAASLFFMIVGLLSAFFAMVALGANMMGGIFQYLLNEKV